MAAPCRLWDQGNGKLLNDIRGNAGKIVAVVFSPDGKTFLTASHDATARSWTLSRAGSSAHPCITPMPSSARPSIRTGRAWRRARRTGSFVVGKCPCRPKLGGADQVRRWVEAQTDLKLDVGQ